MRSDEIKAVFDQQAASYDERWARTAPIRNALHFLLEAVFAPLPAEARAWAERLAAGPSFALEVTKRMLYREAAMDLDAALAAEVEIQSICMQDANFREAYEAFRARRKPEFR